jgi:O-antigen/teichoic acid export membrane protein
VVPVKTVSAGEASRGSAIKLAADTVSRLLSLATTFLIAQRLGPAGFGVFRPLSAAAVIGADLSDLGLQLSASRTLVARALGLGDFLRARLVLTAGVVSATIVVAAVKPALALLIMYFVLTNWGEFAGVTLRARGRRVQEALLLALLRASCLVAVLLAGGSVLAIVSAHALSAVPPLIVAAVLVRHVYQGEGAPAPSRTTAVLRQAIPLGVNNLLVLASLRLELMALPLLRNSLEAGLYGAALSVIEFLVSIPAAIAAGAMPALTREALSRGSAVRRRTVLTAALLGVPAALGLGFVAREVLVVVDAPYAAGAPLLRILAVAVVPLFMSGVLSYVLVAAGAGHVLPRLTAWRLAVAALCAAILIPTLGPVGAACGFVVSEIVLLLLVRRACVRADVRTPLSQPLGLGLAFSLPMAVAVLLIGGGLVLRLVLGVLTYGGTLALAYAFWPGFRRALR